MARVKKLNRAEVWTVDLRGSQGHEISKVRPALIISSNIFHTNSPTIIIIPISSQLPPSIGVEKIFLSKDELPLKKDSVILVNHIRSIDKNRIQKKIGKISQSRMEEVEEALELILEMDN